MAMTLLGNGLFEAKHYEDALSVGEAELAMSRRLGASERDMLVKQNNLASTYRTLGRSEQALQLKRDVNSGHLKLDGEEHESTIIAANNYAGSLIRLERFEETKALLLRTLPAARRTLGESHDLTLSMRSMYANVLYANPSATLDDLREAVETLEETEPIVRRILGGANPTLVPIVRALRAARAKLNAREPPNT